jgi:hypothetical protein
VSLHPASFRPNTKMPTFFYLENFVDVSGPKTPTAAAFEGGDRFAALLDGNRIFQTGKSGVGYVLNATQLGGVGANRQTGAPSKSG